MNAPHMIVLEDNYTAELLEPGNGRHEVKYPVIVVRDHNTGPSVTNTADRVVAKLARTYGLAGKRIIYRDTDGYWDELVHDDWAFTGFRAIQKRDLDAALAVLHERRALDALDRALWPVRRTVKTAAEILDADAARGRAQCRQLEVVLRELEAELFDPDTTPERRHEINEALRRAVGPIDIGAR